MFVIKLLWEKGAAETVLVGGGGGRLDHLFAIRALFDREPCPKRWLTQKQEIFSIEADFQGALPVEPLSTVGIFPAGTPPWRIKSEGLAYPLTLNMRWGGGFCSSSNTVVAPVRFMVEQGRFLVVVELTR